MVQTKIEKSDYDPLAEWQKIFTQILSEKAAIKYYKKEKEKTNERGKNAQKSSK